MYYDPIILRRAMRLGFGAVTAKSITANPRLEAYRRALAGLPHRVPLIVAAAGESAAEYARVVAGLEAFGDLVEINISSPNTRLVYAWSERPAELRDLFRAVRAVTAKPIIVKVSPDFREQNEAHVIPTALDAGIAI